MTPKALIWGESLVGSGHARIQSELAQHLQAKGWEVVVVTGSRAHTDCFDFGQATMLYQPPLHLQAPGADPYNMSHLLTPNGESLLTDKQYRRQRRDRLQDIYQSCQPDVVITEMWPYARANFDFELVPLAKVIRAGPRDKRRPRLYSIARDIMFPPRLSSPHSPNLNNDRHGIAAEFFAPASILVRGDPGFIPLERSIGAVPEMVRDRIDYVGYFASLPPPRDVASVATREVLVSSGGGVTQDSLLLFRKAILARARSNLRDRPWRIIVPHGCPADTFDELVRLGREEDPQGIIVERNRRDFLSLLAGAGLLICHAGNTVVEAVSLGVPVVVVPRSLSMNNLEQQVRAQAFLESGMISLATLAEIEDPGVLAGVAEAAVRPVRPPRPLLIDGAARMAQRVTANWHRDSDALPTAEVVAWDAPRQASA